MTGGFGSRAAAGIVMAVITPACAAGIMRPGATGEGGGGMARMTIQGGSDMWRIRLGILTGRSNTIMAGFTVINDAGMVKHRTGKTAGGMTDSAILARRQMAVCFAYGKGSIMAGNAVIDDTGMVKVSRCKTGRLVADTTVTTGWHMVWRRRFSRGGTTVVAAGAVISDSRVIEAGTGKSNCIVAHRAIYDGGQMAAGFGGGNRCGAIVAGSTVINDTQMIEHGVAEGAGHVTQAAIFTGGDVAGIFLGDCTAGIITMAFTAVVCSAGVVEGGVSKIDGIMADTAFFRGGWMSRRFSSGA